MRTFALVIVVALFAGWAGQAFADPPSQAPAHGWRKKHDRQYVGYTGTEWGNDCDLRSGHCNREEIGAKIGRDLDDSDRACFGHALEIGSTGRRVVWDNPSTSINYALIPGSNSRTKVGVCRDFTLYGSRGEDRWNRKGRACQSDPGVWKII